MRARSTEPTSRCPRAWLVGSITRVRENQKEKEDMVKVGAVLMCVLLGACTQTAAKDGPRGYPDTRQLLDQLQAESGSDGQ